MALHHLSPNWHFLMIFVLCTSPTVGPPLNNEGAISTGAYNGDGKIRFVKCWWPASDQNIVGLTVYDVENETSLVTVQISRHECTVKNMLGTCVTNDTRNSVLVILSGSDVGDTRQFGCNVTFFDGKTRIKQYFTNVSLPGNTDQSDSSTGVPIFLYFIPVVLFLIITNVVSGYMAYKGGYWKSLCCDRKEKTQEERLTDQDTQTDQEAAGTQEQSIQTDQQPGEDGNTQNLRRAAECLCQYKANAETAKHSDGYDSGVSSRFSSRPPSPKNTSRKYNGLRVCKSKGNTTDTEHNPPHDCTAVSQGQVSEQDSAISSAVPSRAASAQALVEDGARCNGDKADVDEEPPYNCTFTAPARNRRPTAPHKLDGPSLLPLMEHR